MAPPPQAGRPSFRDTWLVCDPGLSVVAAVVVAAQVAAVSTDAHVNQPAN